MTFVDIPSDNGPMATINTDAVKFYTVVKESRGKFKVTVCLGDELFVNLNDNTAQETIHIKRLLNQEEQNDGENN